CVPLEPVKKRAKGGGMIGQIELLIDHAFAGPVRRLELAVLAADAFQLSDGDQLLRPRHAIKGCLDTGRPAVDGQDERVSHDGPSLRCPAQCAVSRGNRRRKDSSGRPITWEMLPSTIRI